jgi:DNA polymerase-1
MSLYRLIETGEDVADFTAWIAGRPYLSVDTETTGLDFHDSAFSVRLIQIGSPDFAWLARLDQWPGLFNWLFEKHSGPFVIHNSAYDVPALSVHGVDIPFRKIDDTMIALRIAYPTEPAALKAASRRLLGSDGGGEEALKKAMVKQKWGWGDIPIGFETYLYYAALDVILVSRLYELPEVQRVMASPVYDLEMGVRALSNRMENNGMRIDLDFSRMKFAELSSEAESLKLSYRGIVNLGSTEELGRWFLTNTDRSLLTKRTDRGRIAVDKPILEKIVALGDRDSANVARSVLRVRKAEKLSSSYFANFLTYNHDGIVHPSIDTVAARTSRMSIRSPALQTLPKPNSDPESRLVRQAVLPLRVGEVLMSADMAQIELRIAASLTGDKTLAEAFKEGDFFLKTARDIYDDDTIEKGDDRRNIIKTFWYSYLYGAGVETMSVRAGIPVERMAEVKMGVRAAYPGLIGLQKSIEREARATGGVTTLGGRFLPVDPTTLYAATNYKIQASASEVLKQSLLALGNAGMEDYLLIPVHDEVLFSIPEKWVEEAKRVILPSMENYGDFSVPLLASINGPGKTWADL